jgi:hypothetical protein
VLADAPLEISSTSVPTTAKPTIHPAKERRAVDPALGISTTAMIA